MSAHANSAAALLKKNANIAASVLKRTAEGANIAAAVI